MMAMFESLIAELRHEARATRRVLERVPDDKLSWQPHDKSMTLSQLSMHVARIPRAIADLVAETEVAIPRFPRPEAGSAAELVAELDAGIEYAAKRLEEFGDEGLRVEWRMVNDGKTLLAMPRVAVVRNLMLNHWYHHRGQLTVYLRLLDVALPSVYGPSADEMPF
jgi:uncharacterized damage-inducible protein DinB